MESVVECWQGCDEEFPVSVPADRQSDELNAGVPVACPHCSHPYRFTADGDGEPELQSVDSDSLGVNIDPPASG